MNNPGEKPIIGILGGLGSGKSTVAAEFGKLGCKVIDADSIAHDLLDKPAVKQEVASHFGELILDSSGKIDRRKLADIVFGDGDKLASLNRIIHPIVLERAAELIERFKGEPGVKAIVLDMPLLVEVGWAKKCDRLIFVDCRRQLRMERTEKTGDFDKNQQKIRENFQISLDKKVSMADNVVDNNSDLSALARQVTEIFTNIIDDG